MRIAKLLLEQPETPRLEHVPSILRLTDRFVRYNLPSVEAYLTGHGLRLVKRRGVGIWIDGDRATRSAVIADLATAAGPAVLDAEDRQARVLLALLEAAPEPVRPADLEWRAGVSRPTLRRRRRGAQGG